MTTSRCCSSPPQQKRWPKILLFLCLLQQQPVWGENTYSLVDDANQCDSVNQRNGITTKAECEAAATILGLAETSARVEDNPHGTPGCYIHMSGLWFNTFTTSTVLCSFSTITCICSSPTVSAGITYVEVDSGHCHSTSGRARIETKAMCREAARSVGLTTEMMVQTETWMPWGCLKIEVQTWTPFFNSAVGAKVECTTDKQCICAVGPVCSDTTGSTSNDSPCICDYSVCTTLTGLYCDTGGALCTRGSTCSSTNGALANPVPCSCGISFCYDAPGLYCISSLDFCGKACINLGEYRSATTNGVCTKCPFGQYSDDASDLSRCKVNFIIIINYYYIFFLSRPCFFSLFFLYMSFCFVFFFLQVLFRW